MPKFHHRIRLMKDSGKFSLLKALRIMSHRILSKALARSILRMKATLFQVDKEKK